MSHRLRFLDVVRILSMALVMFGHFVLVGSFAPKIPGIINADKVSLPLLNANDWNLWRFERGFLTSLDTQSAILGVVLFFIVTGYLMPMMAERYSRIGFLINRLFRIIPALIAGTVAVAVFVYFSQGISFTPMNFVGSWTLTYQLIPTTPVIGVLWTLVVEMMFYICVFVIGRFSIHKLFLYQAILLVIIYISNVLPNHFYFEFLARNARHLLIISIGSAIFIAEREQSWFNRIALVLGTMAIVYIGFKLYSYGHNDVTTYGNLGTLLLSVGLFFGLWSLSLVGVYNKLPKVVPWLAEQVYPVYIIHASIGLSTIALFRPLTTAPYVLMIIAIAVTLAIAWLMHVLVEAPGIQLGRTIIAKVASAKPTSQTQMAS